MLTNGYHEPCICDNVHVHVCTFQCDVLHFQVLKSFKDVVWHASWSVTGDILAISGGDNKVSKQKLISKAGIREKSVHV